MNEQSQSKMINQTQINTILDSSSLSSPIRNRTMINVIYISGILFMIAVFLLLLWVNLCSRRCWCWHDTPLVHRFDRQWLMKHSIHRKKNFRTHEEHPNEEFSL